MEWFRTGDIGEIVNGQVKILTRKDRIFKLANAEKVNPTLVENNLLGRCNLLKYVLVFGSGMEQVSALIFPNNDNLCSDSRHDIDNCANPKNIDELSSCLRKCIEDLNGELKKKYESIGTFVIINKELDIEKGELTPSMKVNPQNVINNYSAYIEPLKNPAINKPEDAIYIHVKEVEGFKKNIILH
jgi:long-chain acyl-CoA synthetase